MLQKFRLNKLRNYCPIEILSTQEFSQIIQQSQVINYAAENRLKTIKTQDNLILKFFN